MRRTNVKGLNFDTIKLEGSVFTAEIVGKAVIGSAVKQAEADYRIPRGLRLLDEIGRSFQIACAQWKSFEEGKLNGVRFVEEFFFDALGYSPELFKMLVNIGNPLESISPWYIDCNANHLRLVRKSASLARPSYLEFNLPVILRENRFPEYQMLYRVMHGSRTDGLGNDSKRECIWDIWKKTGEELGVRVREGLRKGVTRALTVLGCGFLTYNSPGNDELRAVLESGEFSAQEYYQELMRLMYRFLFVITVEERNLVYGHLHKAGQMDAELHGKHTLYEKGYSLRRLRERCSRYRISPHHYSDLWEGIKIVFRILGGEKMQNGNPLDLPVLGGLFKSDQCPHLDKCSLSNAHLLEAMYYLRWTVEGNAGTLIDYKNMGSEEFGSVYESLLELVPQVDMPRHSFGFLGIDVEGATTGNTRKTTGSYYTNSSLVECLIKSNLDPLIEEKLSENGDTTKEQKLLSITVIDPACGSGHFLLAAARRLADRLAFLRANDKQPIDEVYRNSLRDVISSCIYGVDLNPLAVELARMALWLEGHDPGKPLSFLDHHIRCGNSLIGVMDFDVLSKGIPDDAYKALSGDDKECATFYKKRNKNEREKKAGAGLDLFEEPIKKATAELTMFHWRLENIQNNSLADIEEKRSLFGKLHQTSEYRNLKKSCDLYVHAFYTLKHGKEPSSFAVLPTSNDVQRACAGLDESQFSKGVNIMATQTAEENKFFHWPLEFPEVFQKGGFDCVLGNPPWERIKLQEEEFFASRNIEIAEAQNKAVRGRLIEALLRGNEYEKQLYRDFIKARRDAESASVFAHVKKEAGGRFPLTGIGDVNTYALFAEAILQIKHKKGRAGFIVPTGIATDDSTKNYFAEISSSNLVSLYDFENRDAIFPSVHRSFKFSLLSLGASEYADLAFFLTNTNQLDDMRRHFRLARDEFMLLNPNTQTCPVFRSKHDAELTKKIYRKVPVLIREKDVCVEEYGNPWGIRFMTMFHMANDSSLFCNEPALDRVPLYEAKMMHQFDHRWTTYTDSDNTANVTAEQKRDASFTVVPRYWVDKNELLEKLAGDDGRKKPIPKWLMGWRDICRATDERTVIASVIPMVASGDTFLLMFSKKQSTVMQLCLLADQNSLIHDYTARQKVAGTHLKYHYKKQIPMLPPSTYSKDDIDFIVPRVLELTYTAVDLIPFAEDLWDSADPKMRRFFLEQRHGTQSAKFEKFTQYDTSHLQEAPKYQDKQARLSDILPPFIFDPDSRALLRASLDARYARLYGLTRDDLRYILDPTDPMGSDYPSETFRVLKEKEIAEHGEYRTQRLVLEAWDRESV